jgi:CubicO group peptidase (beta-lactamase class C family)
VDGSLAGGASHAFSLALSAGDWVYGEVDQKSVDVVVKIRRPDGEEVRTFDGPSRGPEPFTFDADTSGSFTVEVSPFEEGEGNYTITLFRAEPKATEPGARVDQLMTPYSGEERPGGVVAVVRDGEMAFVRAYGMANLTDGVPFQVGTASNIGSVTKQFTALGILLLQAEGRLSIDDDIRTFFPELPDFGVPITLRNFLNHTSGYREIYNFLPMAGFQGEDAFPREMAIRIIQRQPDLQAPPNTEYNYNNTGFILLATTIERVSGKSFPEYMKDRVFEPLGMTHTRVKAYQGEIIPGSAQGYVPVETGGFRTARDLASSYGAGGIYTTAEDLAKWMMNYRDMRVGGPEAVGAMTTRGILQNGDTLPYGLGIGVREFRGRRLLTHTGGDVAHRTYFGYYPDLQSGVILMSNNASFDLSMANEVALAFFGDGFEPEVVEAAEEAGPEGIEGPTQEVLDGLTGSWVIELPGENLGIVFTLEEGKLYAQATGQGKLLLMATSDSTFAIQGVDASVTFHFETDGTAARGTLHQNGDAPMRRVEPVELTPEDLAAYAGRYFSEELETFYRISVEDGKLMANNFRMEPFPLRHREGDTFTGEQFFFGEVEFVRAGNGTVTGFRASNGRTKGVWFRRN